MPRAARRMLVVGAVALALGAGCDRFNPARVSRQRHPELYPALDREVRTGAAAAPEIAPRLEPAAEPDRSEPPSEIQIVAPAPEPLAAAARFDVAGARLAGTVRIDVNDPAFPPRMDALFDGDTATLARTEDVNPLIARFHFETPVTLRAVRIFPSYSTYDWSLQAHPDRPRLMIKDAAEERWSSIELPEAVETTEVRLELRRLVRDNFVHLNEVELLLAED